MNKTSIYTRNFIFGVEDSLVSTVGLLSGIAVSGVDRKAIVLTGIVLVFVEAFSMGIGSLLSEHTAQESEAGKELPLLRASGGAWVMFVSYFLSGFVPLFPYMLFSTGTAFKFSVAFSLIALFLLGVVWSKASGRSILKHGTQMLFLGGAAILVGIAVGKLALNFI